MRALPDIDLSLRDASDFIFDSDLGRKALMDPAPKHLAIVVREIVALIYRLTGSCHLPEFTDHGLPHLCSLIDRVSRWTLAPHPSGAIPSILDKISSAEAGQLLLALLIHDIGMLSQRPEDMHAHDEGWQAKGMRDVPTWVRSTHIERMRGVLHRSFRGTPIGPLLTDVAIDRAVAIASGHGYWPWHPHYDSLTDREAALAAIVAVADLLDEDANRCDIRTLLAHRYGTKSNCAHWIRHGLTSGRVLVTSGTIKVDMAKPAGTDATMAVVFAALRNHFRLALLYQEKLGTIDAQLAPISFSDPTDVPTTEASTLEGWSRVPGFETQSALNYHLLTTFMPIGLLDARRVTAPELARTTGLGMEAINLEPFYAIRGESELRSEDEQAFRALVG